MLAAASSTAIVNALHSSSENPQISLMWDIPFLMIFKYRGSLGSFISISFTSVPFEGDDGHVIVLVGIASKLLDILQKIFDNLLC